MKKKFFSFGLLAAAATIGFLNAPTSVEEFSALELANIEALTRDEASADKYKCYTSFHYEKGASVVDCTTCELLEDKTDALFNFHDWCYK